MSGRSKAAPAPTPPPRPPRPPRKKKARVLTNAECQARWRAKRNQRLRELEELVALRNSTAAPPVVALRKATMNDEDLDDALTRLRRRGDQLAADYATLASAPGLSRAELATIVACFTAWRTRVKDLTPSRERYAAPDRNP